MIQPNYGQQDHGNAGEASQPPSRGSVVVKRYQREGDQRSFIRALVSARAIQRHEATAAGLPTIHWMPRFSDGARHAVVHLPKADQR
jgi:hypothetical protein